LNIASQFAELAPLDRFSEVVSQHVICWAVFDSDLSSPNSVFYKKKYHVDVFGSLAAGLFPVGFQQHCAHVVLIQYLLLQFVALGFNEVSCPEHLRRHVVDAHELRLRGAPRIDLLFFNITVMDTVPIDMVAPVCPLQSL
jgi:hypothetical protein